MGGFAVTGKSEVWPKIKVLNANRTNKDQRKAEYETREKNCQRITLLIGWMLWFFR